MITKPGSFGWNRRICRKLTHRLHAFAENEGSLNYQQMESNMQSIRRNSSCAVPRSHVQDNDEARISWKKIALGGLAAAGAGYVLWQLQSRQNTRCGGALAPCHAGVQAPRSYPSALNSFDTRLLAPPEQDDSCPTWEGANEQRTRSMGERCSMEVNGHTLSYIASNGTGTAGTVLLLHGFPDDATAWRDLAPQLSNAGYHVIALDMPGSGYSDAPADESGYVDTAEATMIAAFIRQLGVGAVHVVGHDWGGLVTHELVQHFPELIRTAASVAGPHTALLTGEIVRGSEQKQKSAYAKTLGAADGATQIADDNYALLRHTLAASGESETSIEYTLAALSARGFSMLGHYRNMGTLALMGRYLQSLLPSWLGGYAPMTTPFLMVQPSHDAFFTRMSLAVPNHYVHGKGVELSGGHFLPNEEAPRVAVELLKFWEGDSSNRTSDN